MFSQPCCIPTMELYAFLSLPVWESFAEKTCSPYIQSLWEVEFLETPLFFCESIAKESCVVVVCIIYILNFTFTSLYLILGAPGYSETALISSLRALEFKWWQRKDSCFLVAELRWKASTLLAGFVHFLWPRHWFIYNLLPWPFAPFPRLCCITTRLAGSLSRWPWSRSITRIQPYALLFLLHWRKGPFRLQQRAFPAGQEEQPI